MLDGVPGRGKGIQCLRRQQKCKLEVVTDILLRGVHWKEAPSPEV